MGYQLGLDTGGTYTDAVLVDDALNVQASAKSLTTHSDLIQGLRGAVDQVIQNVAPDQIDLVCLSTTLATNALVEGRGRSVALLLIGFSPAQMQRARLMEALSGDPHVFIEGGHSASGYPVAELDVAACREFISTVDSQVDAYAVSGMFAVRNPEHENAVQSLIEVMTSKPVTCSHHLSSDLDAPRRALTALLNARLVPMINALLNAARELLAERVISAPLMIVKGDGSLIGDTFASRYPVETILSGPAASVVGARFLCQQASVLVSDMGGTTTDVALIRENQPLLNPNGATVGGWRTMVKAVDVRTFGLGGDSAVSYDLESRTFDIAAHRVMPLSLFAHQYPQALDALEAQLALPLSTTHSAQFVMKHAVKAQDLSAQQAELFERIAEQPVALQTLFNDQTLERALLKLEQRGIVLRIAFTPTDASHILGIQSTWDDRAARLGAQLLMRYSEDNLGQRYQSVQQFATAVCAQVSELTALALVDTAASSGHGARPLSQSQIDLIRMGFRQSLPENSDKALVSVHSQLHVPVVALGAPASSYYPESAQLLGTKLILPEHAEVANALGAVVGVIRQQQSMTIQSAGGKRVSVLFPEGPQEFETLEQGAEAAVAACEALALEKSINAGAADPVVHTDRKDNIVCQGGDTVYFDSCITSVAVGRPASR